MSQAMSAAPHLLYGLCSQQVHPHAIWVEAQQRLLLPFGRRQ